MIIIDRKKINVDKIRNYPTVNESLDKDYGKAGTSSRKKFSEQAHTYTSDDFLYLSDDLKPEMSRIK